MWGLKHMITGKMKSTTQRLQFIDRPHYICGKEIDDYVWESVVRDLWKKVDAKVYRLGDLVLEVI